MKSVFALGALLPCVLAAAVKERNGCQVFNDNYDNIAAPATATDPITNYNGLLYQGWDVINHNSPATAVVPHSEPNVIIASLASDTLIGSVTLSPFGNILRGAGTQAFNLYSFEFGCDILTAQGSADVAEGCTIAVTGFNIYGQQVPEATFAFAPKNAVGAQMVLATLPSSYVLLQNVTIGAANGAVAQSGTVINVDNLIHCNYP